MGLCQLAVFEAAAGRGCVSRLMISASLGESRRGESSGMTVPPRRTGKPVAGQTGDPGGVRGAQQGRWRLRMVRHQGAGALGQARADGRLGLRARRGQLERRIKRGKTAENRRKIGQARHIRDNAWATPHVGKYRTDENHLPGTSLL